MSREFRKSSVKGGFPLLAGFICIDQHQIDTYRWHHINKDDEKCKGRIKLISSNESFWHLKFMVLFWCLFSQISELFFPTRELNWKTSDCNWMDHNQWKEFRWSLLLSKNTCCYAVIDEKIAPWCGSWVSKETNSSINDFGNTRN